MGYNVKKGGIAVKTPGMIRKIDDLGRIVVPSELRRTLDIQSGDEVEMYADGDALVLRKFAPSCIFCGGAEQMVTYGGKNICIYCLRNLRGE